MQSSRRTINSLLTRKEAASTLHISLRKLDELLASGELPRVLIGTCVRIDAKDLEVFIEKSKNI